MYSIYLYVYPPKTVVGSLYSPLEKEELTGVHHISERATWNIDKDTFLPVLTSLKVTALWFLSCSLIEGWDSSRKAPSPVPVAILEFLSSCSFLPPFFFFWFGSLSFLDFEVTMTEGGLLGEGGLAGVGQDGGSETINQIAVNSGCKWEML